MVVVVGRGAAGRGLTARHRFLHVADSHATNPDQAETGTSACGPGCIVSALFLGENIMTTSRPGSIFRAMYGTEQGTVLVLFIEFRMEERHATASCPRLRVSHGAPPYSRISD